MADVDESQARELFLFAENDGDIYRQSTQPFINNYALKMKRGKFDKELAIKGIMNNWVPRVIAKYRKDYGSPGDVNSATKKKIAEDWLDSYMEEIKEKAK